MADDRMKNDDQRNMGGADKGQNYGGQQSPGRGGQSGLDNEQAGQHAGGQKSGGQKGTQNIEDEDDFGAGQVGTQNRGGSQNRGSQNR